MGRQHGDSFGRAVLRGMPSATTGEAPRPVTVNFINRNYPPYSGITGESAAELADYLSSRGVVVNAVLVDAPYTQVGVAKEARDRSYRVGTFYNGKNKFLRLFGNLYEAVRMVRRSQRLRPDVAIYLTEPPFLNICAALLQRRSSKWILWSMDLYPEAFSASHLVSRRNPLYRLLDAIVRRRPPAHVIALGDHQAAYLAEKFPSEVGYTVLPCGVHGDGAAETLGDPPEWARAESRVILGYCGNLGEAHSTEFLRTVIDNLDPARHTLILALYGSRAPGMLAYAHDKPGVKIVPFVRRDELRYIDVHLASLKTEWVDVCVPSKTVSSVCAGSAFLYYGTPNSDNWHMLHDAGWILEDGEATLDARVRQWLDASAASVSEKKASARALAASLVANKEQAFAAIHDVVVRLARDPARL